MLNCRSGGSRRKAGVRAAHPSLRGLGNPFAAGPDAEGPAGAFLDALGSPTDPHLLAPFSPRVMDSERLYQLAMGSGAAPSAPSASAWSLNACIASSS